MQGIAETLDNLLPDDYENLVLLEDIALDLPIELSVYSEEEQLQIEASPLWQTFATSFMPVFHRMKLRITLYERSD